MSDVMERARDEITEQASAYAHGEERPLGGYTAVMATYGVGVVAAAGLVRALRRPVPRPSAGDIGLVALATAKAARLISRDAVTSPIRAPFTRFEGPGGPAEVQESVRGSGVRHSIGELVTCPFCLSQWVATGFTFGLILAPRTTRQIAATFAALELADLVQFGRAIAEHAAS